MSKKYIESAISFDEIQSAHLLLGSGEMSPDSRDRVAKGTHVKKGSGEMSPDYKIIGIRFLLQKIIYLKF